MGIKNIESHFGSVVSSYFTFLRWVVFINIIITIIMFAFVVGPETVTDSIATAERVNKTETRKIIPLNERIHADELAVVWHYDGYVRYSPLFYGYYSDEEFTTFSYPLPLGYFVATLFIFAYSFFAILRKMAANARMLKLSGSKAEQYIFNWRLFTGWDYSIGNSETATNTVMAIVIKLRDDSLWAVLAGMATDAKNLYAAEIAYGALNEGEKVVFLAEARNEQNKDVRSAMFLMLAGRISEAESSLERSDHAYRAVMLNVKMFRWSRALDISLKNKKHLEIVLGYRQKYLDEFNKKETDPKFLKHMGDVEVDWEHIREVVAEEEAKLKDK